jgi:hypothetical protein
VFWKILQVLASGSRTAAIGGDAERHLRSRVLAREAPKLFDDALSVHEHDIGHRNCIPEHHHVDARESRNS